MPSENSKTISVAVKDIRPATEDDLLASQIQESIDTLDNIADEAIDSSDDPTTTNTDANIDHRQDSSLFNPEHKRDDARTVFPSFGDNIKVFWPLDDTYKPGVVDSIDDQSLYHIQYNDDKREVLDMGRENWRFTSNRLSASSSSTKSLELTSSEPEVPKSVFHLFGNRPFLRYQAQ